MLIGVDASRAAAEQKTGTEAYATNLIRHFVPLANEHGLTVRLYFNRPPIEPLTDAPHEQRIIPFPRLWTHIRLAAELHTNPPDIFFTPAHVIPFTYFGTSIATIHDLGYEHFPQAHTPQQLRYLKWSTRHNARRSNIVLADSAATKHDLVTLYGIDEKKIRVVYPAVEKYKEEKYELGSMKYEDVPYFLYVGTLQPRKNLVRLIEAFERVADQVPHDLILAGKHGWLSGEIVRRAAESPITHRIHLPGFVSDEQKTKLLTHATALLFPSLYEGFGFPILEAQQVGTAVLTATNSSMPEVTGSAGLLVSALDVDEIAAGIVQLATHVALRDQLVRLGYENVRRFRWEDAAAHLLNMIMQL